MSKHTPAEEYEVTEDGRVFSVSSNWRGYGRREMRQHLSKDGYFRVRLMVGDKKRKHVSVHKLVAERFLGAKPAWASEIRHLDGNRQNNRIENLAWGTAKENASDRQQHGRTSRGASHSDAIRRGLANSKNKNLQEAQQ